jgi:hypothetical protein
VSVEARETGATRAAAVKIGTELAQTRHTFLLRLKAEGCGWTTTLGGGSGRFPRRRVGAG